MDSFFYKLCKLRKLQKCWCQHFLKKSKMFLNLQGTPLLQLGQIRRPFLIPILSNSKYLRHSFVVYFRTWNFRNFEGTLGLFPYLSRPTSSASHHTFFLNYNDAPYLPHRRFPLKRWYLPQFLPGLLWLLLIISSLNKWNVKQLCF